MQVSYGVLHNLYRPNSTAAPFPQPQPRPRPRPWSLNPPYEGPAAQVSSYRVTKFIEQELPHMDILAAAYY